MGKLIYDVILWNTLFNEVISAQIPPGPEKLKVSLSDRAGESRAGH